MNQSWLIDGKIVARRMRSRLIALYVWAWRPPWYRLQSQTRQRTCLPCDGLSSPLAQIAMHWRGLWLSHVAGLGVVAGTACRCKDYHRSARISAWAAAATMLGPQMRMCGFRWFNLMTLYPRLPYVDELIRLDHQWFFQAIYVSEQYTDYSDVC